MKIMTITGTRPELIRLSVILKKLDLMCNHVHVYTNQNYSADLRDLFFTQLGLRTPDYILPETDRENFLGNAFLQFNKILNKEQPDKLLLLGDTNSGLLTILAAKKGIPVYHMEAGNRCFDGESPEEVNRKLIDSISTYNLPYTESSKQNLINERFHKNFVFKIGNPVKEILNHFKQQISKSDILVKLGLVPITDDAMANYIVLTLHRTENVDVEHRAKSIITAINKIAETRTVIFPVHPRTADRFAVHGIHFHPNIKMVNSLGFFDYTKLLTHSSLLMTDSGAEPEETYHFKIPTIVLRNSTERQELMEAGGFVLAGTKTTDILNAFDYMKNNLYNCAKLDDYEKDNVSDTVLNLLIGRSFNIIKHGHDEY